MSNQKEENADLNAALNEFNEIVHGRKDEKIREAFVNAYLKTHNKHSSEHVYIEPEIQKLNSYLELLRAHPNSGGSSYDERVPQSLIDEARLWGKILALFLMSLHATLELSDRSAQEKCIKHTIIPAAEGIKKAIEKDGKHVKAKFIINRMKEIQRNINTGKVQILSSEVARDLALIAKIFAK